MTGQAQPILETTTPIMNHAPVPPGLPSVPPSAPPSYVTKSGAIVLALVVSLVSSAASIWGYDHYLAQKVVAIDIKSFVEEKKADYIAGRLDDAGLKREMDKLELAVSSIPKNKVVLMGDLVVKNVPIIKP
ncbi:hypothetical protein [Pelobacter propionicus]|uniref:Uncharacterized protein n=1 Tax=Pelobacter propionicus (strain DSM 2379 / NBRC 103807 / OttBd1) TaxID=338966 RepID=A0R7Q1_PELPD|nr:hypothetical protein [Pelobacter propionicus]ABL01359.1 hypothetical protein Ppro_3770 [Pelobacter propionicus DSM 2379]